MSLLAVLAPFDDAALGALASKGLVRRARKETDNDSVVVTEHLDDKATISTDDQTVTIDINGPGKADCTCPATGTCRHILAAVMQLRTVTDRNVSKVDDTDSAPTEAGKEIQEITVSALDELLALSNDQVLKFAGADAANAFTLASNPSQFSVSSEGQNTTVKMLDSHVLVSFIAGQGLKGALYKGLKTKSRLMIASSAILLRAQNGILIKDAEWSGDQQKKPLSKSFLTSIEASLEEALSAVMNGSPDLVADRLFDLSISMRTQSAPRVATQLRGLSKSATLAITRDISFSHEAFLEQLARTYALIYALKQSPSDYAYTGVLKRDYHVRDEMLMYMLGARHWTNPSGARGITAYGFNGKDKSWYTLTNARAAGMDLGFSAKYAYDTALWFGKSIQQMMGFSMDVTGVRVADEGSCATTLADGADFDQNKLGFNELMSSGAVLDDWSVLYNYLLSQLGCGLKRSTKPVPLMVKPSKFGELSFDDFNQCYRWELLDSNDLSVSVIFPEEKDEMVRRLRHQQKRIQGLLLEASVNEGELQFIPVSMVTEAKGKVLITNFQFELLGKESLLERTVGKLREQFPRFSASVDEFHDPVSKLIENVVNKLIKIASSPRQKVNLDSLIGESEDAGLLLLAKNLSELQKEPSPSQLLKSFYVAFEARALLVFRV